ncbi:MAG: hypothetical protein R6X13_00820 [bacterium]
MISLLLALLLASPEAVTRRTEMLAGRDWHAIVHALQVQSRPLAAQHGRSPVVVRDEFSSPMPVARLWSNGWGYWWSDDLPEVLRHMPGVLVR